MHREPLKIYLDTSDYSAFCTCLPNSRQYKVLEFLENVVATRDIEIGFSYPIVFELLQEFSPKFRGERERRAEIVQRLCGANAFRYHSNIYNDKAFSRDGYWYPGRKHFTSTASIVSNIESGLLRSVRDLPADQRKREVLASVKTTQRRMKRLKEYIEAINSGSPLIEIDPFLQVPLVRDVLYRYLCRELTSSQADDELLRLLVDLKMFITVWFDFAGMKNPLANAMDGMEKIRDAVEKLRREYPMLRKMRAEIKKLIDQERRSDPNSPVGKKLLDVRKNMDKALDLRVQMTKREEPIFKNADGFLFDLLCVYFDGNINTSADRALEQSDFVDIMHAFYLPYCDLWRGDSSFSHLLIRAQIRLKERIVPRLLELPGRISSELEQRRPKGDGCPQPAFRKE